MCHTSWYDLSIAGLRLRVVSDVITHVEDQFQPFLTEFDTPDIWAVFQPTDQLPELPEQIIHQDMCYRVHSDHRGQFMRSFFDAPRDYTPYAVSDRESDGSRILVQYLAKGRHCLETLGSSFFHLGLESLLISRDRLCIHAACIRTEFGGVLFSGPSGIGKSTQAALWQRYRGSRQINGDRPILAHAKDGWLAWGSPYAGSSNCHVNESCPVTAIIMLRQAGQCSLRRLPPSEAFRAIWPQLTMHSWDRRQIVDASALAIELTGSVPVYELSCTPNEEAVRALELGLRKDGVI